MNKLDLEQNKNRLLYRELFLKANEGFMHQINSLKTNFFCKNRKFCCKIRYTDLSPVEIFELKSQGEKISTEYVELFRPYGADDSFSYENNNIIDLKLNNDLAMNIHKEYVSSVIEKSNSPVYFYYCKNLQSDNTCLLTGDKKSKQYYLCNSYPNSITSLLPKECGFREWQKQAIDKINNEISRDILVKLKEIDDHRKTFSCKKTGTCCRLASSEFSYEELKFKAENGDNFAKQFTSVFIPYKDIDEARKIYPEYIDFVTSTLGDGEEIYFYHCPLVTEDNLCSIYENRPQVCQEFPNNPLSILPPNCGFCEWKDEVHVASMILHALIEISEFNLQKINNALE